jgi:hypothetical protein
MNEALKKVRIAPGDYAPELTAPEGPSTSGGVQAMQHLRLVPSQADQSAIVVGHANHAAGQAELRTYEHLDAIHRQRFQRQLALDRGQYEAFLGFAKQLFDSLHLKTTLVGPPAGVADDLGPESGSREASPVLFVVLGMALLVVAAVGAWVFLRAG